MALFYHINKGFYLDKRLLNALNGRLYLHDPDHDWALEFGNGGSAGKTNELFFTAGLHKEMHGLFGDIKSA